MKVFSTVMALTFLLSGCAHSQKDAAAPNASPEPAAAAIESALSPSLKVPLPYSFTRRGVDIRVNAVEFTPEQFLVSVTLKETRNEKVELTGSTLMKVRTVSGAEFPYEGWKRDGALQPNPAIRLAAGERFTVDLAYQRITGSEGSPVEIQFPSGKWWSSK